MRRLLITLVALAALALPATADAWIGNVFQSPTGNLVCKYRPSFDSIACGRWNDQRIVSMTAYSSAREGIRMTWGDESPRTLYYGQQYRGIGSRITCGSFYNGIRCTNFRGHGFFINRDTLNRW